MVIQIPDAAEYNGMWLRRSLPDNMPDDRQIAQEMMFCDSRTFLSYNANMRQLVADKLVGCIEPVEKISGSFDKVKPTYASPT